MKRIYIGLIAAGLIVVALAVRFGTGNSMNMNHKPDTQQSNGMSEQPMQNEIFIKNFSFAPAMLTIKKGTTITWTNKDSAHHDISPEMPSSTFAASELLPQGQSYSFTFTVPGKYSYHCSPHPYMKGTIEVTE